MFGFNLDLCPVLDISFDDEADNSLRGRCYGNTVEQVVTNAAAFNDALRGEGVLSCGKHFPGYSRASIDAHHELPTIDLTREQLEAILESCKGNVVHVAERLDTHPRQVYRWIEKHGLSVEHYRKR